MNNISGKQIPVTISVNGNNSNIPTPIIYTPKDNRAIFGFMPAYCKEYILGENILGKKVLYGILSQDTEYPTPDKISKQKAKLAMLGQKIDNSYFVNYCGTKMVILEVTNPNGSQEGYIFYDNILHETTCAILPPSDFAKFKNQISGHKNNP